MGLRARLGRLLNRSDHHLLPRPTGPGGPPVEAGQAGRVHTPSDMRAQDHQQSPRGHAEILIGGSGLKDWTEAASPRDRAAVKEVIR